MSIYKPSNLSPNFEELILDDNQNILNGSFNISFQINTNRSTVRSYMISFYRSGELYRDESNSKALLGQIYGELDKNYKNGETCIINLTQEKLENHGISFKPNEEYKWQIRLYEDLISFGEDGNLKDYKEKYGLEMIDSSQEIKISFGDNDDNKEIMSPEEAFNKYGLYYKQLVLNSQDTENGKVLISNCKENYPILIKKNQGASEIVYPSERQKKYIYYTKNPDGVIGGANIDILYAAGKLPVKGQTLIGEGKLAGTTKDEIWIKNLKEKINVGDYIEMSYSAEDVVNSNIQISKSNTNNSDFFPINRDEKKYDLINSCPEIFGNKVQLKNIDPLKGAVKIVGWGGRQVLDIVYEYDPNSTVKNLQVPKGDFTGIVEKWYIDESDIVEENIKYLNDGNAWVKFDFEFDSRKKSGSLDPNIFLNGEYKNTGKKILSEKLRYNQYKKIITAGKDQYGFYVGISAAEGIMSLFEKVPRDRRVTEQEFYSYAGSLNNEKFVNQKNLFESEYSPMFTSMFKICMTINASIIYKQREKIKYVEQGVNGTPLTYIQLEKEMNFNKMQFGETQNSPAYDSICCINKLNDNFDNNQLYISNGLQSIKIGTSYINIYYFEEDALSLDNDKEYVLSDLPSTCYLIQGYDVDTGMVTIEGGFDSSINIGWKYQILNASNKKSISETEIVDVFKIGVYGTLGDKQYYLRSESSNINEQHFIINNKNIFESICTNHSPFDIGMPISTSDSDADRKLLSDSRIRLFIDPNNAIKTDIYKPMVIELYNQKGTLRLLLDDAMINTLNGMQTLISFKYDLSDYYNNINNREVVEKINLKQSTGINSDILSIYDVTPMYSFMRPETKFRIYSNFIDSEEEGYICVRPNKNIDIFHTDYEGFPHEIRSNGQIQCVSLNLSLKVYDQNDEFKLKNNSKIEWYQIKVYDQSRGEIKKDQRFYRDSGKLFDSKMQYKMNILLPAPSNETHTPTSGIYTIEAFVKDEFGKIFHKKIENVRLSTPQSEGKKINSIRKIFEYDKEKCAIKISATNRNLTGISSNDQMKLLIYKIRKNKNEIERKILLDITDIAENLKTDIYDYNIVNGDILEYEVYYVPCSKEDNALSRTFYFINSEDINICSGWYHICDLNYDAMNNVYIAGEQFSFISNVNVGSMSNQKSKTEFAPMQNYSKVGLGASKAKQGQFEALLGNMQYVEPENNCENDFLLELTEPRNKKYEYYETNEKYLKWRDFITNGNLKLLRFPSGEKYIIGVKDTVDTGFDIRAKNTPSVVKFSWIELESVDDKSTLLFKK